MPRAKAAKSKELPPKERILQAARREFAARGFELASTNTIAQEAKVAKGLLFHYFGSKDDLYLTLMKQAMEDSLKEFWERIKDSPTDLFERISYWSKVRLELIRNDPETYQLISNVITTTPPALRQKLMIATAPLQKLGWEVLMKDIDLSKLRPGVTPQQAIELLMLFSEGFERRLSAMMTGLPEKSEGLVEALTEKANFYLGLIRDGLYQR